MAVNRTIGKIHRQVAELKRNEAVDGVVVVMDEECQFDPFDFIVQFSGRPETPYFKGTFVLDVKIPLGKLPNLV